MATKITKIIIIANGQRVTKVTLYKAFSSKVAIRQGFVIRRYSQRGGSPPYALNITRDQRHQKGVRLAPLPTIFPEAPLGHDGGSAAALCGGRDY